MSRVGKLYFFGFWFLVAIGFFWPVWRGKVPFPGPMLVSTYEPWRSFSFLGFGPGAMPHKAQGIDVVRQLFPWKQLTIDELKAGQMPLWNPYNFSGTPHLANLQTGIFYPLNLLFFILSFNKAWTIFIISQPLLAAWFMYLFLRQLKVSPSGAILGGLSLAFSLYMTVWLEWGNVGHAFLWLPLSLYFCEKFFGDQRRRWLLGLTSALVASILAGYAQATIYLLIVVVFWWFYRSGWSKFSHLGLAGGLAAGLTAIQLLPTIRLFALSARQAYSSSQVRQLLLPLAYLPTLVAPDFFGNPASRNYWFPGTYIERVSYVGLVPLFLALVVLFKPKKPQPVRFFGFAGLIALTFCLNLPPIQWFYGLKIPLLSTVVFTRLLAIFSFSVAVLAGFGFDWCQKKESGKAVKKAGFLLGGVFLALWLVVFFGTNPGLVVSRRNLVLPTGIFLVFLTTLFLKKKLLMAGTALLLTTLDLFFYFHKLTPFSSSQLIYPQTPVTRFLQQRTEIDRFWGYGAGSIDTNFATQLKTYSPEGYDPLFIRRYGELIARAEDIPRSDVVLGNGYPNQRLLNLLGVKYVLGKNGVGPPVHQQDYRLVWEEAGWQIFENRQALPRIFLAGDYQFEPDHQQILGLIYDDQFPLDQKIILEEELPVDFDLDRAVTCRPKVVDYQPSQIIIQTECSGNKLLFISDNYYPGWGCQVDGQPVKLYRADYTFRAVPVPAGNHQVVLRYRPAAFLWGARLTFVSLVFIMIVALVWRKTNLL